MRTENYAAAGRDFVQLIDELDTPFPEFLHNSLVVNDLLSDVQWDPEMLKSEFHGVDGAHHARTESAGPGQKEFCHAARP